jgi:hypothetical protein
MSTILKIRKGNKSEKKICKEGICFGGFCEEEICNEEYYEKKEVSRTERAGSTDDEANSCEEDICEEEEPVRELNDSDNAVYIISVDIYRHQYEAKIISKNDAILLKKLFKLAPNMTIYNNDYDASIPIKKFNHKVYHKPEQVEGFRKLCRLDKFFLGRDTGDLEIIDNMIITAKMWYQLCINKDLLKDINQFDGKKKIKTFDTIDEHFFEDKGIDVESLIDMDVDIELLSSEPFLQNRRIRITYCDTNLTAESFK